MDPRRYSEHARTGGQPGNGRLRITDFHDVAILNPLQIDYTGLVMGSALLAAFLLIPTCCVVASSKLALRHRRSSVSVPLAPFALIALAVIVIRAIPWPAPPEN